jgi:hypothetical protein
VRRLFVTGLGGCLGSELEPGGPGRPKQIVLDCSRARALLRVRLRGAREVLSR